MSNLKKTYLVPTMKIGLTAIFNFLYDSIELPKRATKGSAGYDIRAPHGFLLNAGESIKIPTGLRVHIADGWFLGCMPRSGLGFKYEIRLANTFGVVDSDYINAKKRRAYFC